MLRTEKRVAPPENTKLVCAGDVAPPRGQHPAAGASTSTARRLFRLDQGKQPAVSSYQLPADRWLQQTTRATGPGRGRARGAPPSLVQRTHRRAAAGWCSEAAQQLVVHHFPGGRRRATPHVTSHHTTRDGRAAFPPSQLAVLSSNCLTAPHSSFETAPSMGFNAHQQEDVECPNLLLY